MTHITDKLYNKKWGVFTHYLAKGANPDWNNRIEGFDVKKTARCLHEIGAGYYFITIMQGTKYMLAPNSTYDNIMGTKPGDCCPKRDIIAEMGEELQKYGIDLYLYYTGDGPHLDEIGAKKFGFKYNIDEIWTDEGLIPAKKPVTKEFVEKWTQVLNEFTTRYKDMVCGWWMDGFYKIQFGYTPELIKMYYDAVKAGNPNAICAFNNGVKKEAERWTEYSEFTAGEFKDFTYIPEGRFIDGAQAHILAPLGENWSLPDVKRYDAAYMSNYIKRVNNNDGVVTVEMHIEPDGSFSKEQVEVMKKCNLMLAE